MNKQTKGYYDIDIDIERLVEDGGIIDDFFRLQNLKQRKLYLTSDIDQYSVEEIIRNILQYNKDDACLPATERKPILLYVSSNGGELESGFELIDTIRMSKTPVYTINLGYQYSMGFLIGLAGHKRYASQNATFLMHDGLSLVRNSSAKAQDQMEFQKRFEDRIKQYILSRSKLESDEYDRKLRVEWYLFADEAKKKGFTDYIIGVDCDIDNII